MIKKYTALCLITSTALYANDLPKPGIREMIVIDEEGTGKISSILAANGRLQEEIKEKVNATITKHEQEHKAQYEKHEKEHKNQYKRHEDEYQQIKDSNILSITKELKQHEILLNQQRTEAKENSDQQINLIQKALNSSATYQLLELHLKNSKTELEKKEILRKCLYGATAFSQVAALIAAYNNKSWSLGGSLSLLNGIIFGYGYYVTDDSNTKETIKNLETIRISLRPASTTENKEDENIKVDEEAHV